MLATLYGISPRFKIPDLSLNYSRVYETRVIANPAIVNNHYDAKLAE